MNINEVPQNVNFLGFRMLNDGVPTAEDVLASSEMVRI
jgi:hypothetical protein